MKLSILIIFILCAFAQEDNNAEEGSNEMASLIYHVVMLIIIGVLLGMA